MNSLRVILFLESAILSRNILYLTCVCMYIYNVHEQLRSAGCMWCQCHEERKRESMGPLNRSVYDIALNTYSIGDEKWYWDHEKSHLSHLNAAGSARCMLVEHLCCRSRCSKLWHVLMIMCNLERSQKHLAKQYGIKFASTMVIQKI